MYPEIQPGVISVWNKESLSTKSTWAEQRRKEKGERRNKEDGLLRILKYISNPHILSSLPHKPFVRLKSNLNSIDLGLTHVHDAVVQNDRGSFCSAVDKGTCT